MMRILCRGSANPVLQGQSYETLDAAKRLAILEALLHIAADSEALRSHVQRCMPPEVRSGFALRL
jgi:hypothetical protein